MNLDLAAVQRLLTVIARLRGPDGCPWDKAQTTTSMVPCLIEEAFEAGDALRRGDAELARDELGDVLVNVGLIAQISAEHGGFDFAGIAAAAADKLVRRHPHVFGDRQADADVVAHRGWEQQKQVERQARLRVDAEGKEAGAAQARGALASVPVHLPALLRAWRIGDKAAKVGFDWPDREGPRRKVDEELAELDAAVAAGNPSAIGAELGDLLFSLVNYARHLGVHPELALAGTIDRFQRRFGAVEREFGAALGGRSLAELNAAWDRAKAHEREHDR